MATGVGIHDLMLSAFCVILGIMLTVFACTLIQPPRDPIVVMALVFYIFSPVPYFLCGAQGSQPQGFMNSGPSPLVPISHWLTGAFFAAGPCSALVLYHIGRISMGAFFLSLGSGVMLVLAVMVLIRATRRSQTEDEFA